MCVKLLMRLSYLVLSIFFIYLNCVQMNDRSTEKIAEHIINLERGALDRWGNGDIWGYLELYANEVTYFSPGTERRYDGIDTLKNSFKPIAGQVKVEHYELINPKVQVKGNIAVLTFNEIAFVPEADETLRESHWCCTEVYEKIGNAWKIIHSHWSRPPTHPKTENKEEI